MCIMDSNLTVTLTMPVESRGVISLIWETTGRILITMCRSPFILGSLGFYKPLSYRALLSGQERSTPTSPNRLRVANAGSPSLCHYRISSGSTTQKFPLFVLISVRKLPVGLCRRLEASSSFIASLIYRGIRLNPMATITYEPVFAISN